jgi:hypothetical protein
MSLEMAHKVILPPKKNYIPQFLKQRDINSYSHRTVPETPSQIGFISVKTRGRDIQLSYNAP